MTVESNRALRPRIPGKVVKPPVSSNQMSTLTPDEEELPFDVRRVLHSLTPLEKLLRRTTCMFLDAAIFRQSGARPAKPSYSRVFPAWDGVESAVGRNNKQAWALLVAACESANVNPMEYVTSMLSAWPHTFIPEPRHILDQNKIKQLASKSDIDDDLKRELTLQKSATRNRFYATARINEQMGVTDLSYAHNRVITDSSPPMTPLFRYSYAQNVGNAAAALRIRPMAALQYLLHRKSYDRVWGDLIPSEFKTASTDELGNYSENAIYVPTSFPTIGVSGTGS